MTSRRNFLKTAAAGAAALTVPGCRKIDQTLDHIGPRRKPVVVSTWDHGIAANANAWQILADDGTALDAVESGVRVTEADPEISSVGFGGTPDRDGHVTLDSCIMNEKGDCGSVAFLEHIKHPVSVARAVMEKTPHVMLVGEGALQFALASGFTKENLLTPEAKRAWQQWLETSNYEPEVNVENHDTISMLAIDQTGNLSGSCTTSGLGYKMHGRVGDSPIIGAALFVDNEVGAACATGLGEAVIKTVGSFLVVELMRQGLSPHDACRTAIERIVRTNPLAKSIQVGYLAIDKAGRHGAFSILEGFSYAVQDTTGSQLVAAESWY